jgi:hypothetical protein
MAPASVQVAEEIGKCGRLEQQLKKAVRHRGCRRTAPYARDASVFWIVNNVANISWSRLDTDGAPALAEGDEVATFAH